MFCSSFKSTPAFVPRRCSIDIRPGLEKQNRNAEVACNGRSLKGLLFHGLVLPVR
jgi:hypothetical protein